MTSESHNNDAHRADQSGTTRQQADGGSRQAVDGAEHFVLVDTGHPGIGTPDAQEIDASVPELEVRRADRPLPGTGGTHTSEFESGSRQSSGPQPGDEGGAPGEQASSGV